MSEQVMNPTHYTNGKIETIDKILAVVDGLPSEQAYLLGKIIRYVDRCEDKHDDPTQDLGKANNYAHKLVYGHWRKDDKRRGKRGVSKRKKKKRLRLPL